LAHARLFKRNREGVVLEEHAARYGECECCGTPRILSSAGYCEPCLMLAFAAVDKTSTPEARDAAKIAVLLRATWR
jgi:hypothetical protein